MKNIYRKWIGERLKYFRDLLKLDQSQFAAMIGKTRQCYAAYEEGRAEPAIFTLKQICDIHSITVDKFLEGSPAGALNTEC